MKIFFTALLASVVCWQNPAYGASVKLPGERNQHQKLADQLLVAVLKRGKVYNPVYPYGDIASLPLSTRINDVRNEHLDVFFALATPEYEHEFQAIYFPVYRGLLGYRLAIVKQKNLAQFQHVKTLQDLKQFSAGQGRLWADAAILEANGLPVVKENKYANLFRMLEADRFEYFPRGINEPWLEVERETSLELAIDPYLVLYYQVPFYYFVSKKNRPLAEHIKTQLEAMLQDGSFQKMFYLNAEVKMAIEKSNLSQRTLISLKNPYLTPETPVERKDLWISPEEIKSTFTTETTLR